MNPADFAQLLEFIKTYGILGMLMVALSFVALYLLYRKFNKFMDRIELAVFQTERMCTNLLDDSGELAALKDIKLGMTEIRQDLEAAVEHSHEHWNDTKHLADMEPWQKCDVNRCPNILTCINNLRDIKGDLRQFVAGARGAREDTQKLIGEFAKRFEAKLDWITAEFLAVLRGHYSESDKS